MEKVLQTIEQNSLIKKGDVVAVACSGGQDSMALLHILKSYQEQLDCEIFAVTINHSIRENGKLDAKFVEDYCKKNNIRCYTFNIDVPKLAKEKAMSLESAGRLARYDIFNSLLNKGIADKIAIAHHNQDQAESILMHIFRGAGLSGLKGMTYISKENYIRPLLDVSKNEIIEYIKQNNIPFVQDETNFESAYSRNFLRNEIMPLITKKWPQLYNSLNNLAISASQDDDYINKNLNDHAMIFEDKVCKIPLIYFTYEDSLINRIIFKAIHGIGVFCDIERKHIELIKDLSKLENGKKIKLPMGICAYKEYDYLTLTNVQKPKINFCEPFKCGEINVPNYGNISIKRVKDYNKNSNALYIDFKKLPRDAVWRFRKEGDIFNKFGGGSKKLKSYLIDKKIPQKDRDFIPVLASGNNILVIAGMEISDSVKIEKNSSIIKIQSDQIF